jgi:hypothetical protein
MDAGKTLENCDVFRGKKRLGHDVKVHGFDIVFIVIPH